MKIFSIIFDVLCLLIILAGSVYIYNIGKTNDKQPIINIVSVPSPSPTPTPWQPIPTEVYLPKPTPVPVLKKPTPTSVCYTFNPNSSSSICNQ